MSKNLNGNKLEKTGKNVEEAKAAAALELGVSEDELSIEILENATSGFFGIAAKPCKILAWVNETPQSRAEKFLEKIIPLMGVDAKIDIRESIDALDIEISGENMGLIIGRRGETLDALQYLTSIVVNKDKEEYTRVTIDTEGYRKKRTEVLEKLAHKVAEKVIRNGRSMTLEPMNPFERRVIHATLQDNEKIFTSSVGDDPQRRVVVSLVKKDKQKSKGQGV